MTTARTRKPSKISQRRAKAIVWPLGVEQRYDISTGTRIRWERMGILPKRDAFIGGEAKGWRPETLEAADRGNLANSA